MKLNKLIGGVVLGATLGAASMGANAASVTLDPYSAWAGYIRWNDGLGQIDAISYENPISFDSSATDWSITVDQNRLMSFSTAYDSFVAGDAFALVLDGVQQVWDMTWTDGSGYFHGAMLDLLLTAGTHLITFNVTALAPGYNSGDAYVYFSDTHLAPVPLPGAALLFGSALLGMGALRRKQKAEVAAA